MKSAVVDEENEREQLLLSPLFGDPLLMRQFPLKVFDCFRYRDIKGENKCCPLFFPKSCLCTNQVVGRVHTLLSEEDEVICGLGTQGICCCISLCPCMIYSPTGGFGILCIVSNYLRSQALSKYNVQEVDFFDGCRDYSPTLSSCCNYICYGFHYPCSLFQLFVSIEYWKQEDLLNVATGCDDDANDDDNNNKTRIFDKNVMGNH